MGLIEILLLAALSFNLLAWLVNDVERGEGMPSEMHAGFAVISLTLLGALALVAHW